MAPSVAPLHPAAPCPGPAPVTARKPEPGAGWQALFTGAQRLAALLLVHGCPAFAASLLGPALSLGDLQVIVGACRAAARAGLLARRLDAGFRDPRRFLGRHAQVTEPLVECLVLDAGPGLLLHHVTSILYTVRFAAPCS